MTRRQFLALVSSAPLAGALAPWKPQTPATWTLTIPVSKYVPLQGVFLINHNLGNDARFTTLQSLGTLHTLIGDWEHGGFITRVDRPRPWP